MARDIAIVGAPSSIGLRPYDDGFQRHLNRAPAVLRERGLVSRLRAADLGDVMPPPYHDYARPPGGIRNEAQVAAYSHALARRVSMAIADRRFGVVLGGDCSIVLGCLLAARQRAGHGIGLVYVDAHADFATPEESAHGGASGMALALATGRGHSPLARLAGARPLVNSDRVVLVGRRDAVNQRPDSDAFRDASFLEVPSVQLRQDDWLEMAAVTLDRVAADDAGGFWIQIDADVLNPALMPAVDAPEAGGPTPGELVRMLTPLVRHPRALGLSLTIYDPALDPDRSGARLLVSMLEALLGNLATSNRLSGQAPSVEARRA